MRDPLDEIAELRIELGRVTDQRDAFKAALHKYVFEVIRDVIREDLECRRAMGGYVTEKTARPKIEPCQESWSENWERRLKDLEGLGKGQAIINEANQKDVVKLEGDHELMDNKIDRLSHILTSKDRELMEHILGLKMALERMDARIKQLEVKGNEPTF